MLYMLYTSIRFKVETDLVTHSQNLKKAHLLLLDLSQCQMQVNLEKEKQFLMSFMIPSIIEIQTE
jgi:hypothetical protein